MPRTSLLFAPIALALSTLAGCSSGPAPTLAITNAQVTERTDAGMVVTFTIQADNASPEPLPLREVEYQVSLHGKPVFQGTRSAQATVRSFGSQTFTLPAAIPLGPNEPAPTGVAPYTIEGRITYLVPGALAEALFDMKVLRPSTGFAGRGVVELK